MTLYSNLKRMITMFSSAIIVLTLIILALRLTVFSDIAAVSAPEVVAETNEMQNNEIEGNSDFPYQLNSKIYYPDAKSKGNVLILNPDTNKYLLSINIILADTKDSLYYTGAIAPGTSIEFANLSAPGQELADGVYECIAQVSAIDAVSMTKVAEEEKPVSIYIGQKP